MLCLEGQLSRKWTTNLGSVHQITTSNVCVQHCHKPETNVGTIILITVLPMSLCMCICVYVLLEYCLGYKRNHKSICSPGPEWFHVPRAGDVCVLDYAGKAGFVLTWRVCVGLKESSCFIRLSEGGLVPYSWANKDSVQTLAYKLSSIFILAPKIWNH